MSHLRNSLKWDLVHLAGFFADSHLYTFSSTSFNSFILLTHSSLVVALAAVHHNCLISNPWYSFLKLACKRLTQNLTSAPLNKEPNTASSPFYLSLIMVNILGSSIIKSSFKSCRNHFQELVFSCLNNSNIILRWSKFSGIFLNQYLKNSIF